MLRRLTITDHQSFEEIMDYCQLNHIAVVQSRSYQNQQQTLAWQIYCEDSAKLSFLLLKFGSALD